MMAWRIDPQTGETRRVPSRGSVERRQPSAAKIEHMRWDWFPLAVWSGKETLARLMLEDAGLVTFCPVEVRWRNTNKYDKARRAKRQIGYPVIPGLVFVGIRKPYPWHVVMAPHVVSYVVSDNPVAPKRIANDGIGRLIAAKDAGRFVRPDEQRHMPTGKEFGEGDQVHMWRGAFQGKRLRVEKIEGAMLGAFAWFFGEVRLIWLPLSDAELDE